MIRSLIVVCFLVLITAGLACSVPLHKINGPEQTGEVVIRCDPDDAKVFVDGVYVGQAKRFDSPDRPLKVTLGVHIIELRRDEYQRELREVSAGHQRTELTVKMQLRPKPPEDDES